MSGPWMYRVQVAAWACVRGVPPVASDRVLGVCLDVCL